MILLALTAWICLSVVLGLTIGPWVRRRAYAAQARVECGWCSRLIQDGGGPISHGVCDACLEELLIPANDEASGSRKEATLASATKGV